MNNRYLFSSIYILTALLIFVFFLGFFILPFFSIKEIKLDSSLSFTRDIKYIAGLDNYSSFLFVDPDDIERRILEEPLVRKVYVEKTFPSTLNITVFGRKALATAYIDQEGISVPLCFDENGVVFQIGDEIEDVNLPVISGDIDFDTVTMGGELPKVLVPLLRSLKEIRGVSPDYYSAISEIMVTKRGEMTFDLIIHFTFSPIKAMVRDLLSAEELKNIIVVISLLEEEALSINHVDFREDEIVYREKE